MRFFGVIGEIGGNYYDFGLIPGQPPPSMVDSRYNFMAGPKAVVRLNRFVTPFAQALFGDVRAGNNFGGYEHFFASQFAGGIDVFVKRPLGVRVQVDNRRISATDAQVNEFRFAFGAVVVR